MDPFTYLLTVSQMPREQQEQVLSKLDPSAAVRMDYLLETAEWEPAWSR
jgi:hypothetical protein